MVNLEVRGRTATEITGNHFPDNTHGKTERDNYLSSPSPQGESTTRLKKLNTEPLTHRPGDRMSLDRLLH